MSRNIDLSAHAVQVLEELESHLNGQIHELRRQHEDLNDRLGEAIEYRDTISSIIAACSDR